MEILTTVNAIANAIITVTVVLFTIYIYGHSVKFNKLPALEKLFVKIGLAVTACGSLFNFLTLSTPPHTEILLNCGLAILFTWGVWFHYKSYKH